jgi:hypothetical protein
MQYHSPGQGDDEGPLQSRIVVVEQISNYSGHFIKLVFKQRQIWDSIRLGYDGFCTNQFHERRG